MPPTTREALASTDLIDIETQMRLLLPADLYAAVWMDPVPDNLMRVFQHLRTLQYTLRDYIPRQVADHPPEIGEVRYSWQEGTLLFTDLAGFTPLLEANAASGRTGASTLFHLLNDYFSQMIEIIGKSGGDLLEFTGDAMLVQFLADSQGSDAAQAVRAGLRMQRAMAPFQEIDTPYGRFSLGMRVGIHAGRFLTADIGTPKRMAHVLMGSTVQQAKQAEGVGRVGRVCLTQAVSNRLQNQFHLERLPSGHSLVDDDFTTEALGEYDISLNRRRFFSPVLMDRSAAGLLEEIRGALRRVEPLASYLPSAILNLLVESTAQRQIPPDFPEPTVVFINLTGLAETIDQAATDELDALTACFSRAFALIHAAAKARGGVLQKVTYHSIGSDMLLYFGALSGRRDDPIRAAETALVIREIVAQLPTPPSGGVPVQIASRIGIASGAVFAAEIGEPRGRREFNILGDPVNTAARLMTAAERNQILITEDVYWAIAHRFTCGALGDKQLKGKSTAIPVLELRSLSSSETASEGLGFRGGSGPSRLP